MSIPYDSRARTFRTSAAHFFSVWNLAILLVLLILVFSLLKPDTFLTAFTFVGSSRVDLQACKLEYSIVSPK